MAKGHRLLKKVKSERAKVKLKGSKYLPKGTNVTDTSFKIKQIVIREQLKTADNGELLSKRKLNLKELLTRVLHYNTSVRSDAVNGLKELVTLYPEQSVIRNLNQLLQGVSQVILDQEKIVRREALKLIAMILVPVGLDQIMPFFDILCSYLRCAMTHIDTNIQEDSLLLLDILLATFPSLVADNSYKILPNFFDLISKLRSNSTPERTLTVHLGSKITSVKWRIKVLNRLYGILNAVLSEKANKNQLKLLKIDVKTIHFDSSKCTYMPIYHCDYISQNILNLQSGLMKNLGTNIGENEEDILKYIDVLVPLLFETWLEVGPGTKTKDANLDSVLSEEATAVLNCILKIFQLIWQYIKIYEEEYGNQEFGTKFISTYNKEFSNFILKLFPYSQSNIRMKKNNEKRKAMVVGGDYTCLAENLMICHLFSIFNPNLHQKWQKDIAVKIVKYIVSCLHQNRITESTETFQQSVLVLKTIFLDVSKFWLNSSIDVTNLLEETIKYYERNHISERNKYELFNILCQVEHCEHLNRISNFQIWLSTLPSLLLAPQISERIVDIMCLLAKQKNVLFIQALKNKYPQILNNITNINVTLCDNKYPVIFKIINIFFWVPIYDEENLNILHVFLKNNTDIIVNKYFRNLLQLRYELKKEHIILKYLE